MLGLLDLYCGAVSDLARWHPPLGRQGAQPLDTPTSRYRSNSSRIYLLNQVPGYGLRYFVLLGALLSAIETDPQHPRHILTVRGSGYRLVT